MKGKSIVRVIACFLSGIMVMMVVFKYTGIMSYAAHPETAMLYYDNWSSGAHGLDLGEKRLYAKSHMNRYEEGLNLPAPFNSHEIRAISMGQVWDMDRDYNTPAYCIEFAKVSGQCDTISSKASHTASILNNEQATMINTVLILGNSAEEIRQSNLKVNNFYHLQMLVWIIKEGYLNNDAKRAQIESFFFKYFPSIEEKYKETYKKLKDAYTYPSFVNDNVNILKYNSGTRKYELTLENTISNAMEYLVVDESSLPEGVTATLNGNKLKLVSNKEIPSEVSIKLKRDYKQKGGLVVWSNEGGTRQAQVSLDFDEEPLLPTMNIRLETAKTSTPSTESQVTVREESVPTTESVATDTSIPEEDVAYQVKELPEVSGDSQLDDVPKTADESCIYYMMMLMGASVIAMAEIFVYKKIKQR